MFGFTQKECDVVQKLFTKCTFGKLYNLSPDQDGYKTILSALNKLCDQYGIVEFLTEKKEKFRIILKKNKVLEKLGVDVDDGFSDTRLLRGVGSNRISKPYIRTKIENKELIQAEIDSKRRPIPGVCSRPDIVSKIIEEYNRPEKEKQEKLKKEQERLKKIKEWKEN